MVDGSIFRPPSAPSSAETAPCPSTTRVLMRLGQLEFGISGADQQELRSIVGEAVFAATVAQQVGHGRAQLFFPHQEDGQQWPWDLHQLSRRHVILQNSPKEQMLRCNDPTWCRKTHGLL